MEVTSGSGPSGTTGRPVPGTTRAPAMVQPLPRGTCAACGVGAEPVGSRLCTNCGRQLFPTTAETPTNRSHQVRTSGRPTRPSPPRGAPRSARPLPPPAGPPSRTRCRRRRPTTTIPHPRSRPWRRRAGQWSPLANRPAHRGRLRSWASWPARRWWSRCWAWCWRPVRMTAAVASSPTHQRRALRTARHVDDGRADRHGGRRRRPRFDRADLAGDDLGDDDAPPGDSGDPGDDAATRPDGVHSGIDRTGHRPGVPTTNCQ